MYYTEVTTFVLPSKIGIGVYEVDVVEETGSYVYLQVIKVLISINMNYGIGSETSVTKGWAKELLNKDLSKAYRVAIMDVMQVKR